jgi:hypothetical protein
VLTDSWRDIIALLSLVLTTAGLVYAIVQIRKTKSAVEAANEATTQTLAESQSRFQRYTASNANRFLNEAKIHLEHQEWEKASGRMNDVADQASLLSPLAGGWEQTAEALRTWASICESLAVKKRKKFPKPKWAAFVGTLQQRLNAIISP